MRFLVSSYAPCLVDKRGALVLTQAEVTESAFNSHIVRIHAAHRLLDRRGLLGQHHRRRNWHLVTGLSLNSDVKVDLSACTHKLLAIRADKVFEAERILAKLIRSENEVLLRRFCTFNDDVIMRTGNDVVNVELAAVLDSKVEANLFKRLVDPRVEARFCVGLHPGCERRCAHKWREHNSEEEELHETRNANVPQAHHGYVRVVARQNVSRVKSLYLTQRSNIVTNNTICQYPAVGAVN